MLKPWLRFEDVQLAPHPFRRLLHVEWILLGMAIVAQIELTWLDVPVTTMPVDELGNPLPPVLLPSVVMLSIVALFGLMGLRLPQGNLLGKLIYTGCEFALIDIGAVWTGGCLECFSFLMLIAVIRSCLMFRLPGRLAIAGFTLVTFVIGQAWAIWYWDLLDLEVLAESGLDPAALDRLETLTAGQIRTILLQLLIDSTLYFSLILVLVLLLTNTLVGERDGRKKLAIAHDQLRQYSLKIEDQAKLQERNRIARDIHDSLGHVLTAQSIQLKNALLALPKTSDTQKSQGFLEESKQLGAQALTELRQSVSTLQSDAKPDQPFDQLLLQLCQSFSRMTQIATTCDIDAPPMPPELGTAVHHIVEEALTNMYKYSGADQATICVRGNQQQPLSLTLEIQDNGRGFRVEQTRTGFGLRSMQDRVQALEGTLQVTSKPGAGCHITATFPVSRGLT